MLEVRNGNFKLPTTILYSFFSDADILNLVAMVLPFRQGLSRCLCPQVVDLRL